MPEMQIIQEILIVIFTSVASLIALFFLTRLGGKRQIAQMSAFDYVNSITIGSIAAEMATNLEQWYRPLTAMIIYGVTVCLVHYCSCKSIKARAFFSGRPIILMENGKIYQEELSKSKIDLNEFLSQARIAGYFDLNEIECALLETSGQISFLPKSESKPATPDDLGIKSDSVSIWYDLVIDGKLMEQNLKISGRERSWLDSQLSRTGIGQLSEVFYAACDKDGNFFACRGK